MRVVAEVVGWEVLFLEQEFFAMEGVSSVVVERVQRGVVGVVVVLNGLHVRILFADLLAYHLFEVWLLNHELLRQEVFFVLHLERVLPHRLLVAAVFQEDPSVFEVVCNFFHLPWRFFPSEL